MILEIIGWSNNAPPISWIGSGVLSLIWITLGIILARRRSHLASIDVAKSVRVAKWGIFFFLIAFIPIGTLVGVSVNVEVLLEKIAGADKTVPVVLILCAAALFWKADRRLYDWKDAVLYSASSFLAGLAAGAAVRLAYVADIG